ncbi:MAG: winged helix-turn-helix domain-containing protein, partial [Vicinamibacterales bacterium]
MLRYLVAHAGRIVTKQELIEVVWGGVAVTDDSLVQCLIEIRRALGPAHEAVRTIRGRGYILEVPPGDEASVGPSAEAAPAVPPPPVPTGGRWTFAAVATAALAAVGALVAGPGARAVPAAPVAPHLTLNDEVRQAVDDGVALLRRSRAQVDIQRARQRFERAVQLDPEYAPGHAALGNVLVLLSGFGVEPPQTLLPRASAAARRAVALDATLAAGWQALAHTQTQWDWDWPGAEQSYRRALALDPAAPFNMIFAHLLVGVGRLDEAVAESDRWLDVEPTSALRLGSNCVVKYLARQPAAAIRACERALDADPTLTLGHFWSALAHVSLGDHAAAMRSALAAHQSVTFSPTWVVGYVHARAGRTAEAREVLRALTARAVDGYVPPVELALLHAALGETTEALALLERAYHQRGRWMELLAVLPPADPLRGEP